MFQLTMSHIHDLEASTQYDTDSSVPHIADALVGMEAFCKYIDVLSLECGVEFTLDTNLADRTGIVLAAQAQMRGPHGPSTIYVELQAPVPHDDPDDIVRLMDLMMKPTAVAKMP